MECPLCKRKCNILGNISVCYFCYIININENNWEHYYHDDVGLLSKLKNINMTDIKQKIYSTKDLEKLSKYIIFI